MIQYITMVSILNFGDSPFFFLFILVTGIFTLTLIINLTTYLLTELVKYRTSRLLKAKR